MTETPLNTLPDGRAEWLEADGLGGFASGTVSGIRTRRYHALLLTATTPPTGRVVLVNGIEAWVETKAGRFALSSHRYAPDVVYPDGRNRIFGFTTDPWPTWTYLLEDGTRVEHELFMPHGSPTVAMRWRITAGSRDAQLFVRPLMSGRDYHSLHRENGGFRFDPTPDGHGVCWHPYPGLPGIRAHSNGKYEHGPDWYRNFLYEHERDRGLDCIEDLASPGVIRWDLSGDAVWMLSAGPVAAEGSDSIRMYAERREAELARRKKFSSPLHRAADAYIVRRGEGTTIIAGYPWFTDWGRDTFIALRGLCLAGSRLDDAGAILRDWAATVSEGMLPNRFPDAGGEPEYNAVDASLWFIVAVHEYLKARETDDPSAASEERRTLAAAVNAILTGYSRGTRFGIRADADGLLAAGESGVQLTWMDARVDGREITPRIGKPVEIQALWLNALWAGKAFDPRWGDGLERGLRSFRKRFWNDAGYLNDVVDCDHRLGTADPTFRPNQIFAVGGLPLNLLERDQAAAVVAAVEERLWTPMGLRSLAPSDPAYRGRYRGGVAERDGAYHQGTVWPWLAGPFVEAWVRVRGGKPAAKVEARRRFLDPLLRQMGETGLGHLAEIADGDPPYTPNGCPFQAWSVGEVMRLDRDVLK